MKKHYDFLNKSYSRERNKEKTERKHASISIEQIQDDIRLLNRHGSIPTALQVDSAENEFFYAFHKKDHSLMISLVKNELQRLSPECQALILSFMNGSSIIQELAERYGITERAVFYRRRKLADRLAENIRKGLKNESFKL